MAFAKITSSIKANFNNGIGSPHGVFYNLTDIEIILGQPGAINQIELRDTVINGQNVTVIVAVNQADATGVIAALDEVGDLIALPCPPHIDEEGGKRIPLP